MKAMPITTVTRVVDDQLRVSVTRRGRTSARVGSCCRRRSVSAYSPSAATAAMNDGSHHHDGVHVIKSLAIRHRRQEDERTSMEIDSSSAVNSSRTELTKDSERDPVTVAREYGFDIGLLQANLRLTPEERIRQLDAILSFISRMRRV
jgi:hypothetical protein